MESALFAAGFHRIMLVFPREGIRPWVPQTCCVNGGTTQLSVCKAHGQRVPALALGHGFPMLPSCGAGEAGAAPGHRRGHGVLPASRTCPEHREEEPGTAPRPWRPEPAQHRLAMERGPAASGMRYSAQAQVSTGGTILWAAQHPSGCRRDCRLPLRRPVRSGEPVWALFVLREHRERGSECLDVRCCRF